MIKKIVITGETIEAAAMGLGPVNAWDYCGEELKESYRKTVRKVLDSVIAASEQDAGGGELKTGNVGSRHKEPTNSELEPDGKLC